MPFGIEHARDDRPYKTWQEAEQDLQTLQYTSWEIGARCVKRAPPDKSFCILTPTGESITTKELWQPLIRSPDLPFDIIFDQPMTKEMAITAAIAHGKKFGGKPLTKVKGAQA